MPTIQISALFKTQEANESECFKKTAQKVLMKMYVVGSIFYQIAKVEYAISAKMYSAVHVNYLV